MVEKVTDVAPEKPEWVATFLATLSQTPNVSGACAAAGISRTHAYRCRDTDPVFASAWDDALEQATDALVADVWGRAKGADASDTLAIFLLKAHRPAVYRETVRQIHDFSNLSDAELLARATGVIAGSRPPGPDAPVA